MTTLFSACASLCRRKFSTRRKSLLFHRQQTGQKRPYMKGSFFTRPFHANACERMPTTTTTPKTKTSHLQHNIEPCKCIFCSEMWKRSWITPQRRAGSSRPTKKRTPWRDAFLDRPMRQLLPSILPRHLGQVMTILPLPRGTRHTVRQLGQVKYL